MNVPHAVLVNECKGVLYVADRENSRVLEFNLQNQELGQRFDLGKFGMPYGITMGSYGSLLALCWKRNSNEVWVVMIDTQGMISSLQCIPTNVKSLLSFEPYACWSDGFRCEQFASVFGIMARFVLCSAIFYRQ
jgi:DNA-binding beta-propeller fold protein YncE